MKVVELEDLLADLLVLQKADNWAVLMEFQLVEQLGPQWADLKVVQWAALMVEN